MSLPQAIAMLINEYEKACRLSFVHNPIAYALHKMWKKADKEGGRNEL